MRKIALAAACAAALTATAPAAAEAGIPSYQDRLDVKRFARDYWAQRGEVALCSGVRFRWRNYVEDGAIRGGLAYQHGCTVTFNKRVRWGYMPRYGWGDDWWRLCATAIHEYGHLPGMPYDRWHGPVHTSNPNSIMARAEQLNYDAWWWPHFPACRYQGDDGDGDGLPDYRAARSRGPA